jgi:nitrous oxide reductase accessory protein NosL
MKKILYTLLAVSIIFAACKKEEDDVVTPAI